MQAISFYTEEEDGVRWGRKAGRAIARAEWAAEGKTCRFRFWWRSSIKPQAWRAR